MTKTPKKSATAAEQAQVKTAQLRAWLFAFLRKQDDALREKQIYAGLKAQLDTIGATKSMLHTQLIQAEKNEQVDVVKQGFIKFYSVQASTVGTDNPASEKLERAVGATRSKRGVHGNTNPDVDIQIVKSTGALRIFSQGLLIQISVV